MSWIIGISIYLVLSFIGGTLNVFLNSKKKYEEHFEDGTDFFVGFFVWPFALIAIPLTYLYAASVALSIIWSDYIRKFRK